MRRGASPYQPFSNCIISPDSLICLGFGFFLPDRTASPDQRYFVPPFATLFEAIFRSLFNHLCVVIIQTYICDLLKVSAIADTFLLWSVRWRTPVLSC